MFAIMKDEPPQPSTVDTISPVWDEILKKALAKNRDDRYATVKEFVRAVKDCSGSLSNHLGPDVPVPLEGSAS